MARFIKYILPTLVLLLSSQLLPAKQVLRVGVGDVYIAFKDKDIRNKAMQEIKTNGTLDKIYKEYETYLKS
jgi:hypothetical protein